MVSVSVCVSVCMCLCVHDVPFINLVSLALMSNELKCAKCEFFKKIHNFKNIIDRCIISSLWVAPVLMHNCAKYEDS